MSTPAQSDRGGSSPAEREAFAATTGYAATCEADYNAAREEYERTHSSRAFQEMWDAERAWERASRAEKRHSVGK